MGCCDRGRRDRAQADPAPERGAGRERRRAGLAERSGDDEEMAVAALVGVGRPPREMRARVAFLEEERRDAARDLVGRDAEVDHGHAPGACRARIQEQAPLVAGEGGGQVGADRRPEERARVRAETGRQVERDDRPPGGIDQLDGAGHEPAGGAGEPGAEERIDHHVSAPEVARRAGRGRPRAPISSTRPAEPAEAPRGRHRRHRRAGRPGRSARARPSPGVGARRRSRRRHCSPCRRESTTRLPRMGANVRAIASAAPVPGPLHQPDPGNPERRDGARVERPHLGRREDGQQATPARRSVRGERRRAERRRGASPNRRRT